MSLMTTYSPHLQALVLLVAATTAAAAITATAAALSA